jgi:hypothetical protein
MGYVEMKAGFDSVRVFPVPRKKSNPMPLPVLVENPITSVYPLVRAKGPETHLSMVRILKAPNRPLSTRNILEVSVRTCITPEVAMLVFRLK